MLECGSCAYSETKRDVTTVLGATRGRRGTTTKHYRGTWGRGGRGCRGMRRFGQTSFLVTLS